MEHTNSRKREGGKLGKGIGRDRGRERDRMKKGEEADGGKMG